MTTPGWSQSCPGTGVTVIVNTTTGTMVTLYLGRRSHTNTSTTTMHRQEMEGTSMMREVRVSTILLTTEITHSMKTTFTACINIMTRSTSVSGLQTEHLYPK